MGLFSNNTADIISEAALGAENTRQHYDNLALEQQNKREAEARRQAEAEASAMAAQAKAATAKVKAMDDENLALKTRILDFELAVDDVAAIINSPSLNAAWKVSTSRAKADVAEVEYRNGLATLERRYRNVLQKVLDTLGNEYGIPAVKIQSLIRATYERSCHSIQDKDIPQGIGEDRKETYLFWDEKTKSLVEKRAALNNYIHVMNDAIDQLEHLRKVRAMRKAEKDLQNGPSPLK